MGDNIPVRGTGRTYPGGLPVSVRERPVTEDDELGEIWKVKPSYAHQIKLNACRYAADVVNLRRAKGNIEGACSYAVPMEHALAGLSCGDERYREALTDGREDELQAEADRNPTEQTVRALVRYRAVMRQASLDDDKRRCAEVGIQL